MYSKPNERTVNVEKKFKFSDNPKAAKITYAAVVALLCITAIIVGIVAANNRKTGEPIIDSNPPINNGGENNSGENTDNTDNSQIPDGDSDKVSFISPVVGTVVKKHSTTTPVFSNTLEEWRIHTGIDVSTAEGADVFAAADGEVCEVRSDALLGKTVVIMHSNGMKTVYSTLSPDGLPAVGDRVLSGQKIGTVGDSAISEIADEAHLHFEMLVNDVSVNPLDYISEAAKETSLGIKNEESV